jgi:hypothetical protein
MDVIESTPVMIDVRMTDAEAGAMHQMATRVLKVWEDEGQEGLHVDTITQVRRRLESALRANGWSPGVDGRWTKPLGRRRR